MRIRMLATMAGPQGVYRPGDVLDVDETAGKSLVAGGYAELIGPPAPVETAEEPTERVEQAVGRPTRGRRK